MSGMAADYEKILLPYEEDIRIDRNNMTKEEHGTLLEAYKAHQRINENSTKEEIQLAKDNNSYSMSKGEK